MSTPVLKTGRAVFIEIKTFENIAGKNPAGKMSMSIMLHFDNLSRSNSSIKIGKGGGFGLSYIIFWCGDTDISQRIFKLSGFNKPIKSITFDMIIDHSGHELFSVHSP